MALPYGQFYFADWLSNGAVIEMTPAQEGIYIRTLALLWQSDDCSVPADRAKLIRMQKREATVDDLEVVLKEFTTHPDRPDRLTQKKLFRIWNDSNAKSEKARKAAQIMHANAHANAHANHEPITMNHEPESNIQNPEEDSHVAQARPFADQISDLFELWKKTFDHPRAKLDGKRKKKLRDALKLGYTKDECAEAIIGCSYTPHNQGVNDRNTRYDGLHIIFRDADSIDRFIANCHNPPGNMSTKTQGNVVSMQRAMDRIAKEGE